MEKKKPSGRPQTEITSYNMHRNNSIHYKHRTEQLLKYSWRQMDQRCSIDAPQKTPRSLRNKATRRKTFIDGGRPPKRLFTPEIKKYLKDWLIRRRDNPYPSRGEKKTLATETGLTYIQICNWFANWRRKLKSSEKNVQPNSWGHLIKTYNNRTSGNVEQFSICSDDSIWEEFDSVAEDLSLKKTHNDNVKSVLNTAQCFTISSTTEESKHLSTNNLNKYKNNIMEKYLKGLQMNDDKIDLEYEDNKPCELTKWLMSAAKFQPSQINYSMYNDRRTFFQNNIPKQPIRSIKTSIPSNKDYKQDILTLYNDDVLKHGLEEVEAAVALTRLAGLK